VLRQVRGAGFAPVLMALLLTGPLQPVQGAQPEIDRRASVERLAVLLVLHPDGILDVRESLELRFEGGTFQEGFREIPTGRLTSLDGVRVSSPDLEILDLRVNTGRTRTEIVWGFAPSEGVVRFDLEYRVAGVVQLREGRNILDWDAVGTGWQIPLGDVSVRMVLPAFDLRAEDFEAFPPPEQTELREAPSDAFERVGADAFEILFQAGDLPARTSYRVVVAFPARMPGAPPPPPPGPMEPIGPWLLLSLLLGIAFPSVTAFSFRTRTPAVQLQGLGPSSLPVGWIARLMGRTAWVDSALPATLVAMARRGVITLEVVGGEDEGVGGPSKEAVGSEDEDLSAGDLRVRLPADARSSDPLERALLERFSADPSYQKFRLGKPKGTGSDLRGLMTVVEEEMTRAGLMEPRTDRTRVVQRLGVTLLVLGPLSLVLPAVRALPGATPGMLVVFSVCAGLGFIITGIKNWALTEAGERVRAEHLAYMRDQRKRILADLRVRPDRAHAAFVDHLELLLASAAGSPGWFARADKAFRKAGVELPMPAWMTRGDLGVGEGGSSDPLRPLFAYQLLWNASTPGGLAAKAEASGATPSLGGGVGSSGGFGGGGGGFR
jgi:hypothetical protein